MTQLPVALQSLMIEWMRERKCCVNGGPKMSDCRHLRTVSGAGREERGEKERERRADQDRTGVLAAHQETPDPRRIRSAVLRSRGFAPAAPCSSGLLFVLFVLSLDLLGYKMYFTKVPTGSVHE